MDFTFSDQQLAWEQKSTAFALKEIKPQVERLEEDLELRQTLFAMMGKEGFFSLTTTQIDPLAYILALKAIAKIDAGIAVAMAVTNMVAEAIALFGSNEQKRKYLPKITSGDCVPASFALTEELAGSDAQQIETKAIKNEQGYRLHGKKQFITNGDMAGVLIIFAKDEQGMSAFLVDKGTPGLKVVKKERKLGLLTANLVSLELEHCQLPDCSLLGQSGKGFHIAMKSLDSGRIGIAAQALGIAEAAFEAALSFSQERIQFGHPIADHQAITFKLADMKVKLDAAFGLLFKAAWQKEKGMSYTLAASEAKLFSSEISNEIAAEAVQIFGGRGYVKDYPVEKYYRDARVTTLYEGTSEIQRIVISRAILTK